MGSGLVPEPRSWLPRGARRLPLCWSNCLLHTRAVRVLGFPLGGLEHEQVPDGEKGAPADLVSSYFLFPYGCFKLPGQGDREVARRSRKKLGEGKGRWEGCPCQDEKAAGRQQHQGPPGGQLAEAGRSGPGRGAQVLTDGMARFPGLGLALLLLAFACFPQPMLSTSSP